MNSAIKPEPENAEPFVFADADQCLLCPLCGETYVHIDDVYVAGRPREDGAIVPVHVDSGGRVLDGSQVSLPIPNVGRRHAIVLRGRCETCAGTFTLEFKQHKGQTVLAIRQPIWEEVEAFGLRK